MTTNNEMKERTRMIQQTILSRVEPQEFTKRPVTIKAMHFDGTNTKECCQFIGRQSIGSCTPGECIEIFTLEGPMRASVGDYIVCGVKGEFYPVKPEIFVATYLATRPTPRGEDERE